VIYRVEEGPQVRVANIVVTGLKRTEEEVVRRALALKPGDTYDPDAIAKSQAALLRLGVFRAVAFRLNDPEVPEAVKDLTVECSERPWQYFEPFLGVSIANGLFALVDFG